ncbi:MAG: MerR family transcriptional regulator [Candidatus Omnitrophota bacterium]|nr:MerR family transcriptional regulator [Candidatus Omnitrophota bacterium]
MVDKNLISIEEVVRLFDISRSTVNYYSNLGLFQIADKKGNKRLYNKAKIERTLNKINSLRRQGYTLRLIQQSFLNSNRRRGLSLK